MTAIFDLPAETLGEHVDRLAAVEAAADTVQAWQPMLVPGLLQSYSYAAAAIHAGAPALPLPVVDERAAARTTRIDRVGRPGARRITAVIDQSALYRPVGGVDTLADQLDRILALDALQPTLTVRVLPRGMDDHPGLLGAFTLYRVAGRWGVFTESLTASQISARPVDVAAYASAWDRLLGLALPPRESVELIEEARGTLCRRTKTA
ncbi:DUF5753 domain-containing protein [Streptomyces sp. NPDC093260]|uniref:DUF5753 domain-containing protein n=1 Tax=Streptomyces sp. NPDC093260 TaxID=3155073 RepID=UPI003447D536